MRGEKVLIVLKIINLGLRFILELIALISFGYWGFKINGALILKVSLGIGIPLITAIIWGLFASPKAVWPISKTFHWILLFIIYISSAFALYNSGKKYFAILFLVTAAINSFLMYIWRQ